MGMGPGWAGGGVYRVPTQLLGERPRTAKRAPEALQGLEWVVLGLGRTGRAGRAMYHPSGPVGHLRCPPCTLPLDMPSLANRARFHDIS